MAGLTPREMAAKADSPLTYEGMVNNNMSGVLNRELTEGFRDLLIKKAVMLEDNEVRVIDQAKMAEDYDGFPEMISWPMNADGGIDEANYVGPHMERIEWDCSQFMAVMPLMDRVVRNNKLKGTLGSHLMSKATPRVALDMEILGRKSAKTVPSPLGPRFQKFDGLFTQPTAHVMNPATPVPPGRTLFYYMQLSLPSQYWRDLPNMRYYVSPNHFATYQMGLQALTSDAAFGMIAKDSQGNLSYNGVPIFVVPDWPDNYCMLTHCKNIVWALEQGIEWELWRKGEKSQWLYIVRYAFDVKIGIDDACVLHKNVAVPVVPSD